MDPLTHSLVGALAGKALQAPKRRIWIMALLGLAPDLDVISALFAGAPWWIQHRGITHSALGLIVQTLFYAALLSRWDPGRFLNRASAYGLPLCLHVLGDFLTGYGVPFFSPFTMAEVSGGILVNVSVLPLCFMGAGFAWLILRPAKEGVAVRGMIAAWILYLSFGLTTKVYAASFLPDTSRDVRFLPTVYNPFHWRAVEEDETRHLYRIHDLDLTGDGAGPPVEIAMPNGDFPVRASLQSILAQNVAETGVWPVVRVENEDNGWTVEWGEIMFSVRGMVRNKVRVRLDEKGQVLSDEPIFGFYIP